MIKNTPEEIIKAELNAGEILLWSHVVSYDVAVPKAGMNSKILKLLLKWHKIIIALAYALLLIWVVMRMPPAEITKMLETQLPIFGATLVFLVILMLVLKKTNILETLDESHLVHSSCIITDRRVLLFNYYAPERVEYAQEDIADVNLDYENGSRALRFKPNNKDKDSVLIGIADFDAALAVLRPFKDAA